MIPKLATKSKTIKSLYEKISQVDKFDLIYSCGTDTSITGDQAGITTQNGVEEGDPLMMYTFINSDIFIIASSNGNKVIDEQKMYNCLLTYLYKEVLPQKNMEKFFNSTLDEIGRLKVCLIHVFLFSDRFESARDKFFHVIESFNNDRYINELVDEACNTKDKDNYLNSMHKLIIYFLKTCADEDMQQKFTLFLTKDCFREFMTSKDGFEDLKNLCMYSYKSVASYYGRFHNIDCSFNIFTAR